MYLSLHRHNEAIRDWMERGRSNALPTLDEDSPSSDTPLPSTPFTSLVHEQGVTEEVQERADETVGDTTLASERQDLVHKKGKKKGSNSSIKSMRKKRIRVMITQPTLVQVMMETTTTMVMEEVMLEQMVQVVVV
jgi:hypothetical protein